MDADVRFGQIALAHDLINKKQHDEAWKTLKELRRKQKGKGKAKGKGKKQPQGPRLVDVLVQRKLLTGRQARSVENARLFQQARLEDKLYARIVLKSKFAKNKQVEKGLAAQRESYLEGEELVRLSAFLLEKNWLTEEQDDAIQGALRKLDVERYMGGKSAKGKSGGASSEASEDGSDDLGSDEESAIDLGSDVEELDGSGSGVAVEEIDLDSLEAAGSDENIDDAQSMNELDSEIDGALSGISDDEFDLDDEGDGDDDDDPPPHGLSSDDLGSDDLDDPEDEEADDDLDLGSGIDLDSAEVAAASGRSPKIKGKGPKGKGPKAPVKGKGKGPKAPVKGKGKGPKAPVKGKGAKAAPSEESEFDLSDVDLD